MSSNVNIYDAPPLRRAGVFDTTTTAGGDLTHTHQRISWAAIFGGVILVVAVQRCSAYWERASALGP
jgi:hypothetical protein